MKIAFLILYLFASVSLLSCQSENGCEEKDISCRAKYYMKLLKEKKISELKKHVALQEAVNNDSKDRMLSHIADFIADNDTLSLNYKIVGNEYSDVLEVRVYVNDTSFYTKLPIIIFDFAQNVIHGIPLINWTVSGIPRKKVVLTKK